MIDKRPPTRVYGEPLARGLLAYYAEHGEDRGLPWRSPLCPPELRVLVEALLVRTRAEAVARRWRSILGDLEGVDGWLGLPFDERLRRAGLLGLARPKRQLADALAELVQSNRNQPTTDPLHGMGPKRGEVGYCVGVYRLLLDLPGGPVDDDVERVAMRYGCEPGRLVDGVTRGAIIADRVGRPDGYESPPVGVLRWGEPPAPYRAFAALLDVGTLLCSTRTPPRCNRCPLARWCRRANDATKRRERSRRYARKRAR